MENRFYRAMRCISAVVAVIRCLSVCLSPLPITWLSCIGHASTICVDNNRGRKRK